jgi:branched-chain amino acid transport system substrate-binding protein
MKSKILTGIMLILLSTLLLTGFNAPVSASDTKLTGVISIGALLSMSGDLKTFGENEKEAAEFAVSEVNALLNASKAGWTLSLVVEDTQTKPDVCLTKVESLHSMGIDLLVGPLSSGEVRAIKAYTDSNNMLAISQASTAPDLAIANDSIFRFCPTDKTGQGPAIGRILYADGKRYIIPVERNDPWGVGLRDAAKTKFEALGGHFLTDIAYDPSTTDFSAVASTLKDQVTAALGTSGINTTNLGILDISFEEVNALMTACNAYTILKTVKWYGTDGTANSGSMLMDATVRSFALNVSYPSTIFAPTHSDVWEKVRDHCIAVLGREPESYSYVVYDIVWVYALSLMAVDKYDAEAVRAVLPTVTRNYFGASGWIELDDAGDRKAGDYEIWQITEISPGRYDWKIVGRYLQATDSVVWGPLAPSPVYVFEPVWNSKIFYVVTESNSTVSDYYLNPYEGPFIRFNVTGPPGTVGFCRVAIPKRLLWVENGNWMVLVGGNPVNATVIKEDDYYTYLYFTYNHSTKTVEITGTNVVPEFPATLILPLFLVLTLIAVAITKKIRCKVTAKTT